ncbi:MAG TPA: outer membrane protein transport protein [Polyangia bacterium]|nr:outer membrane protein transport protein [Polyangia bacterium]
MKRKRLFILSLSTVLPLTAGAAPAFADGGYYQGAVGPRAAGRGGAFVARADDVSAVAINPAGLATLGGTVVEIGNQVGYNRYDYTRAPTLDTGNPQNGTAPLVSFDKVSNGAPWQPALPFIGVASNLGLKDFGFALAAFAPPGISKLQFPIDGGQRYMMVSREAVILDYAASIAWKLRDVFGVGLTAEWISVPRLDYSLVINANPAPGAANPVSSMYDILATTTGSDPFVFNAILGTWFRPVPSFQFGLAGQVVPASIVTHSKLAATALDQAQLGTVTLLRNGVPASDVTVTLPLPLMVRAGGRYRNLVNGRERFDLEVDVEYETWSRANAFTVATNGLEATAAGNQTIKLGTIEIPKQWNDVLSVKVGGDVNVIPDRLTLRAGVYYETAAAPAATLNVDFPAGQQLGAALGGSLLLGRWEVALTYQLRYQPATAVSEANARVYQQVPASPCAAPYTDANTCNPNYPGQPSPAVNAGTYAATSHLVALGLIYRYGR